jgi:phosphoglycolate phosphatase
MPPRAAPVAVAFDLDGTLLDSFDAIYEATVLALRDVCGCERARAWRIADAREHEGRPLDEIARRAAGPEDAPAVVQRYRAHFPEVAARVVRPYPDVAPALEALSRAGVPLGVASNKPALIARGLLDRFGLARSFRTILGTGDRMPPKPHPWLLVEAARALGTPPRMVAFVGDSAVDVATAKAAHAHAWLVARESSPPAQADRVLRSLEEIPAILAAARAG